MAADAIVRLYRETEKKRDELAHATLARAQTFEDFLRAVGEYRAMTNCMEAAKALFHADDNED